MKSINNVYTLSVMVIRKYCMERRCVIARLLGHLFGDGWLSKSRSVGFSGDDCDSDMILIKRDMKYLGFSSSNIYNRVCTSEITTQAGRKLKVVGKGISIMASRRAFNFFMELGAPVGDKASKVFLIPDFIINGNTNVKEFLAALMGSDGYLQPTLKKSPQSFYPSRLSFNKVEELEENAIVYANQLKTLFEELGIRVSQIKKEKANIRKDGKRTYKFVITISNSVCNTRNFLETIGFRYCLHKEIETENRIMYLMEKSREVDRLEKIAIETRKMRSEQHTSLREISRQVGINKTTLKRWLSDDKIKIRAYSFPSYREWIEENKGIVNFRK
jgi:hypothetical protein